MVRNIDFICLGNNIWEGTFTNTLIEIMDILGHENRVLYVNYAYTLKDIIEGIRGQKNISIKKILGIQPRLIKIKSRSGSEIFVLTPPPVIPLNKITSDKFFRILLKLNARIVESQIKRSIKQLKFKSPVLISGFNPYYGLMLQGRLSEILNIYYCYDEIDSGWHKRHGPKIEQEYLRKADLIITSSEYLFKKKEQYNPNCHLIKNGVNFKAFNCQRSDRMNSEKTIIGYTGSLDSRFDTELMSYIIENLPEAEFLFAGRVTNDAAFKKLRKFNNVTFLGAQMPDEVPAIVARINLGIVPYLKTSFTKGVYPLKFNEYLAAGKPVVSTDFADLPEFKDVIRFCCNKEDFLNAIKYELHEDNEYAVHKRVQFASMNSWHDRSEKFSMLIENALLIK